MSQMVVDYNRNVSSLLAMISAVCGMTNERHLQAEKVLLPQLFAFGHQNYSRYLAYQRVMLSNLQETNPSAWEELKSKGLEGA